MDETETETDGKIEKEGVAAMTAGIVANELSAEAIQAAIAAADSAVGSYPSCDVFLITLGEKGVTSLIYTK